MTEAFDPGFPVHLYQPGMELPKSGTYYLVAGNGVWLHKDTGIVKAFVPVKGVSPLEDLDADVFVECGLPKLPVRHVWRIKEFFRKVVQEYHAEAATNLYYRKSDQSFKIHIPQQQVSHGGVNYERVGLTHLENMQDYLRVGTIHSHCDFNAFHSGTDIGDENDFDGLHCTFGHNDKSEFSISASVVVNGVRRKVDPESVLEGIVPCEKQKSFFKKNEDDFFTIEDVDEETTKNWSEDLDLWMNQVSGHRRSPISSFWGQIKEDGIAVGDQVEWAGDLKLVSFREMCGNGPFEVVSVDKKQLTVSTDIGLAQFDEKLFRKKK